MTAAAPARNAITRGVLTMRCTVWSRTANTGPYNNAVKTGLACRLAPVNTRAAAGGPQRAELAALRVFKWDPTYTLPEQGVQVEVTSPAVYAGQKWNPQVGTHRLSIPPGYNGPISAQCDVRRAS